MLFPGKFIAEDALAILRIRRIGFACLMTWAVGCAGVVRAQEGAASGLGPKIPAYDVVSIKPMRGPLEFTGAMDDPDGTHVVDTLKGLVSYAYGVRPEFVVCDIKTCDAEVFDVRAKVAGKDVAELAKLTLEQRGLMLQGVLAERFGVKVHTEARPLRVYNLVIAKGGSKVPAHPPNTVPHTSFANGRPSDGVLRFKGTEVIGYAVTIGSFANTIAGTFPDSVERPVIDKTGLQGKYDFNLKWTAEKSGSTSPDGVGDGGQPADAGQSIFTALQEQLGLRLQPATESMPMIVVDEAHMPSAN
jgi:uncharacterized protein (TIGR03435 family)